jgi:peptide deformylase
MPIRKVTIEGVDEILRQPARALRDDEFATDELRQLAADMVETMRAENGAGIAAQQVGESIRICIVDTEDGPAALCNPTIVRRSKKVDVDVEGCLSCPGKEIPVARAREVDVKARTVEGEAINFTARQFLARVVQHELDHLDGILIVDK